MNKTLYDFLKGFNILEKKKGANIFRVKVQHAIYILPKKIYLKRKKIV